MHTNPLGIVSADAQALRAKTKKQYLATLAKDGWLMLYTRPDKPGRVIRYNTVATASKTTPSLPSQTGDGGSCIVPHCPGLPGEVPRHTRHTLGVPVRPRTSHIGPLE